MDKKQPAEGRLLYNGADRLNQSQPALPSHEANYKITVAGHLDEHWAEWLGGLGIEYDPQGNTVLHGAIPDQAALHGLLVQIRDLGLTLIAIKLAEESASRP